MLELLVCYSFLLYPLPMQVSMSELANLGFICWRVLNLFYVFESFYMLLFESCCAIGYSFLVGPLHWWCSCTPKFNGTLILRLLLICCLLRSISFVNWGFLLFTCFPTVDQFGLYVHAPDLVIPAKTWLNFVLQIHKRR